MLSEAKYPENVSKEQEKFYFYQIKNNPSRRIWSGHLVSKEMAFIGGLTIFLVVAAIFAVKAYGYYQNKRIDTIDCHFGESVSGMIRNFNYYKSAVEQRGLAADQYCLAEALKKGVGTHPSLKDARNLYKKAADQGLTLAQKALCVSEMFPDTELDYSEFESACCPTRSPLSFPECPWMRFTD